MKILDPYLKKSNLINKDIKKMFVKNFNQKLDCLISVSQIILKIKKKLFLRAEKKKESFSMLKIFLKIKVFKFKILTFNVVHNSSEGDQKIKKKNFQKIKNIRIIDMVINKVKNQKRFLIL